MSPARRTADIDVSHPVVIMVTVVTAERSVKWQKPVKPSVIADAGGTRAWIRHVPPRGGRTAIMAGDPSTRRVAHVCRFP